MAKRFQDKTVFITGGSSGIGAALGVEFARQGARVALMARGGDRLETARRRILDVGGEVLALVGDVTDRASLDAAVERTVGAFGGLDIAIANAGFGVSGSFARLATKDYRRQFDTNFFGVLDTAYAVLPHLQASRGRLAIVSSVLGQVGMPDVSPYCASKFALCGLAESLYYELGRLGIAVTCILPGIVDSNIRRVDNRGVFHPGSPDTVPRWLCVPTERAARAMVRSLYRRRPLVVITGHGKIITWLHRHYPGTFRKAFSFAFRWKVV
jgi:NAD(P)-dependent dehydrogenase (short-subunit alcohol dehydrogenase family)